MYVGRTPKRIVVQYREHPVARHARHPDESMACGRGSSWIFAPPESRFRGPVPGAVIGNSTLDNTLGWRVPHRCHSTNFNAPLFIAGSWQRAAP